MDDKTEVLHQYPNAFCGFIPRTEDFYISCRSSKWAIPTIIGYGKTEEEAWSTAADRVRRG